MTSPLLTLLSLVLLLPFIASQTTTPYEFLLPHLQQQPLLVRGQPRPLQRHRLLPRLPDPAVRQHPHRRLRAGPEPHRAAVGHRHRQQPRRHQPLHPPLPRVRRRRRHPAHRHLVGQHGVGAGHHVRVQLHVAAGGVCDLVGAGPDHQPEPGHQRSEHRRLQLRGAHRRGWVDHQRLLLLLPRAAVQPLGAPSPTAPCSSTRPPASATRPRRPPTPSCSRSRSTRRGAPCP